MPSIHSSHGDSHRPHAGQAAWPLQTSCGTGGGTTTGGEGGGGGGGEPTTVTTVITRDSFSGRSLPLVGGQHQRCPPVNTVLYIYLCPGTKQHLAYLCVHVCVCGLTFELKVLYVLVYTPLMRNYSTHLTSWLTKPTPEVSSASVKDVSMVCVLQ